jgi:hypothetical protein
MKATYLIEMIILHKKSLKIGNQAIQWPNEKDKGTNNDLQNITQKTKKTEQHEPHLNLGVNSGTPEG